MNSILPVPWAFIEAFYLPLVIACGIGAALIIFLRKRLGREKSVLVAGFSVPVTALLLSFALVRIPSSIESVRGEAWRDLWLFVFLPTFLLLGLILGHLVDSIIENAGTTAGRVSGRARSPSTR